ncbi:hypothetical protein [Chitinophaga sp. CF418]|uniref:hypothetical protein n=1 Tax=Chitinophaga sp. CF418 TaxID=1855287 RepID=UPI00091B3496|nr:hypothetical protein [Chitinophaga sp. CF418]SHN45409.1 hypothetical protein SAMN05216311_12038 [Chitinophaga sp. CF418]
MILGGGKRLTQYQMEASDWLEYTMKDSCDRKDYYKEYLELSETWMKQKAGIAKLELERLDKVCADEFAELGDVNEYERRKLDVLENVNPQILLDSSFLMIYISLEEQLRDVCKGIYLADDDMDIPRYGSNIIESYYSIIKRFGDFSSLDSIWDKVLQFRDLRNGIVHNKFPKPLITRQIVLDLNEAVWELIWGIYKLVDLPDNLPPKALLKPIKKPKKKKK